MKRLTLVLMLVTLAYGEPVVFPEIDLDKADAPGIPKHDARVWRTPDTWPNEIRLSNRVFRVQFTHLIVTTNKIVDSATMLDRSKRHTATYEPHNEAAWESDWPFGPLVKWRPDGSMVYMSYHRGDGTSIVRWFAPNGVAVSETLFDASEDFAIQILRDLDGEKIGYETHSFGNEKTEETYSCWWRGAPTDMCNFRRNANRWKKQFANSKSPQQDESTVPSKAAPSASSDVR